MQINLRWTAATLALSTGLPLLLAAPAQASKAGRRNTALLLGGIAAYGVVKKQPVIAGVAGAGAIYSFIRSQQSDNNDRDRRRRRRVRGPRRVVYRERVVERPVYYSNDRGYSSYAPVDYSHGKHKGWSHGMPPGQAKKMYGKHCR